MKQKFFRDRDLSKLQINRLRRLEHIIDITDTGISRKEELHISVQNYDGAQRLAHSGDDKAIEISRWLEDNYDVMLNIGMSDAATSCGFTLMQKGLTPFTY